MGVPAAHDLATFVSLESDVWSEKSAEAQRKAVGKLLGIEDGPSGGATSPSSIQLDHAYSHLQFSRRVGLNAGQTAAFYEIMVRLQEMLLDPQASQKLLFMEYRRLILENAKGEEKTSKEEVKDAPVGATPPVDDDAAVEAITATSDKDGEKEEKQLEEETAAADKEKENDAGEVDEFADTIPEAATISRQFGMENVKQITQYVTDGIFGHFSLYRAIYCIGMFEKEAHPQQIPVMLQTVIADGMSLSDAIDLDMPRAAEMPAEEANTEPLPTDEAEENKKVEQPEQEKEQEQVESVAMLEEQTEEDVIPVPENIAALAEAQAKRARASMESMLNERSNAFDKTIEELEAKKGK